jgi:hypothetical protein
MTAGEGLDAWRTRSWTHGAGTRALLERRTCSTLTGHTSTPDITPGPPATWRPGWPNTRSTAERGCCRWPRRPGSAGHLHTWPGGRPRERHLKTQGGASRRCPECDVRPRTPTDQRKDITAMRKPKDRSAESKPGTRPPEYVVVTWVSEQLRDRIQRCGPSLDEALRTTNTPERTSEPELEAEP